MSKPELSQWWPRSSLLGHYGTLKLVPGNFLIHQSVNCSSSAVLAETHGAWARQMTGVMGTTAVAPKQDPEVFVFSSLLQMGSRNISVPDRGVMGVRGILQSLKDHGALQGGALQKHLAGSSPSAVSPCRACGPQMGYRGARGQAKGTEAKG